MATTRKRTPGFNTKVEETTEEKEVEALLEAAADEVLSESKPAPVVIESIVPTEDVGPRFVETLVVEDEVEEPQLAPKPVRTSAPLKAHPPKRHPRNIPKYTRYKNL
jgi:hypothetical protein